MARPKIRYLDREGRLQIHASLTAQPQPVEDPDMPQLLCRVVESYAMRYFGVDSEPPRRDLVATLANLAACDDEQLRERQPVLDHYISRELATTAVRLSGGVEGRAALHAEAIAVLAEMRAISDRAVDDCRDFTDDERARYETKRAGLRQRMSELELDPCAWPVDRLRRVAKESIARVPVKGKREVKKIELELLAVLSRYWALGGMPPRPCDPPPRVLASEGRELNAWLKTRRFASFTAFAAYIGARVRAVAGGRRQPVGQSTIRGRKTGGRKKL